MPSVIEHKLTLAVRLVDTTNGQTVEGVTQFKVDGQTVRPLTKTDGLHVFMGELPERFWLEGYVEGYEAFRSEIVRDSAPRAPNVMDVEVIPEGGGRTGWDCLTLTGRKAGVTEIDAVRLGENMCLMREFDARKRVMTVFNPHKLRLERRQYAVVNLEKQRYERFVIVRHISETALKIEKPLTEDISEGFAISAVISGRVREDGEYLLRVRDTFADCRYLVRSGMGDKASFEVVDFRESGKSV